MKLATNIAGGLLGLLFIAFSLIVLLNLVHPPPMPEGTPAAMFMGALGPTGYFKFIKVCELIGGMPSGRPADAKLRPSDPGADRGEHPGV